MTISLSEKVLSDGTYIKGCVDLYKSLAPLAGSSESFQDYLAQNTVGLQLCIDTIYVVSGWLAMPEASSDEFVTNELQNNAPVIRMVITQLAVHCANS